MTSEELHKLIINNNNGEGAYLTNMQAVILAYNLGVEKAAEQIDDFSIEQNQQNVLNLKIITKNKTINGSN